MDAAYLERLVDAYTDLQRRERRTDLDFAEIARRASTILGRTLPQQTVGRWMRGKVQPRDPQERKAFAEALGTTVGSLFYAEGTKKPAEEAGVLDLQADPLRDTAMNEEAARAAVAASRAERSGTPATVPKGRKANGRRG